MKTHLISSSAGTDKISAFRVRVLGPNPVLDKDRAAMGPEIYPLLRLKVERIALEHFQIAVLYCNL